MPGCRGVSVVWLGCRTRICRFNSQPQHCLFIDEIGDPFFVGKLSWDITTMQVYSALHGWRGSSVGKALDLQLRGYAFPSRVVALGKPLTPVCPVRRECLTGHQSR